LYAGRRATRGGDRVGFSIVHWLILLVPVVIVAIVLLRQRRR